MLGRTEGTRRRGWQDENGITELNGRELKQTLGKVKDREAWHIAVYGIAAESWT